MIDTDNYTTIVNKLMQKNATLVAVSKIKPVADIEQLYHLGQLDFGENYVQELVDKQEQLPKDVRWHFIGHLQTNKVKYIAPFVHLIHGVDSMKLLKEINKHAQKNNRIINTLLQIHIAKEETKHGLDEVEMSKLFEEFTKERHNLKNINILGLMGMASFSDDKTIVRNEFKHLKALFDTYAVHEFPNWHFRILSMGMSGDYDIALEEGSNMIRVGSLIFGKRKPAQKG